MQIKILFSIENSQSMNMKNQISNCHKFNISQTGHYRHLSNHQNFFFSNEKHRMWENKQTKKKKKIDLLKLNENLNCDIGFKLVYYYKCNDGEINKNDVGIPYLVREKTKKG